MRFRFAGLIFFVGGACFGQQAPIGLMESRPKSLASAVKDAPYSAEVYQVTTQLGRNGSEGKETYRTSKVFRDSQGRVRTESKIPIGSPGGSHVLVTLIDATDGRKCYLNTEEKVAHCFTSIPVVALNLFPGSANVTLEDLGTKTIAGVLVRGTRYNRTSPGTTELWISPELQIEIESKGDSPGVMNTSTTNNLRREEPDARLFEIPGDFQTVNETGDRALIFGPAPPPARELPAGVYRVGSGVTAPKVIKKVEPRYTEEARHKKIEGTVTLSLVVDANGRPTDLLVERSLDKGLDQEAIKVVKEWRFEPGRKEGKPVAVLAQVEINFRLLPSSN